MKYHVVDYKIMGNNRIYERWSMKYIKLFATGGTFDKEFNEIRGI